MLACKDCSCPTNDTNRDGVATCEACAHLENLTAAVDRFCDLFIEHTREFAMHRASIENDVTLAQLSTALDSYLMPVC